MNLLTNVLLILDECESVLGDDIIELLQELFTAIKICVPILVLVLIIVDMVRAVTSDDEEKIKKAQSRAVKRLIIGVAFFFMPDLINIILKLAGLPGLDGTCGIG